MIQDLGAGLVKEDIMSEKMKTDMDHVADRWNKLSHQVCTMMIFFRYYPEIGKGRDRVEVLASACFFCLRCLFVFHLSSCVILALDYSLYSFS